MVPMLIPAADVVPAGAAVVSVPAANVAIVAVGIDVGIDMSIVVIYVLKVCVDGSGCFSSVPVCQ